MKTVIAYALTILGPTQFVGMFVGSLLSLPVAWAVPDHLKWRIVPRLQGFLSRTFISLAAADRRVLPVRV